MYVLSLGNAECWLIFTIISWTDSVVNLQWSNQSHIKRAIEMWQEAQLSQRDRATHYVRWNLVDCCTVVRKIASWKSLFKIIRNDEIQWAYITSHQRYVVITPVSIWHRCREIATFTVYVAVRDLEKSFSFATTVEITGQLHVVYAFRFSCKHIVVMCGIFS